MLLIPLSLVSLLLFDGWQAQQLVEPRINFPTPHLLDSLPHLGHGRLEGVLDVLLKCRLIDIIDHIEHLLLVHDGR